ncbi:MAG: hypothetical protein Q9227_006891 [Pyrenula ochraceoflavens]
MPRVLQELDRNSSLATRGRKEQEQQDRVEIHKRKSLNTRSLRSRPLTTCPGGGLPQSHNRFVKSRCGPGSDRRYYNVWCTTDEGGDWDVGWYWGRCDDDEICFHYGSGDESIAYCQETGLGRQSALLLGSNERLLRRQVPPEVDDVPILADFGGTSYQPTSPNAHRFEVVLTGHGATNSVYWAKWLIVQPLKKGKPLGKATVCSDCVRSEVQAWPEDADAFELTLGTKKASDKMTATWARILQPYL